MRISYRHTWKFTRRVPPGARQCRRGNQLIASSFLPHLNWFSSGLLPWIMFLKKHHQRSLRRHLILHFLFSLPSPFFSEIIPLHFMRIMVQLMMRSVHDHALFWPFPRGSRKRPFTPDALLILIGSWISWGSASKTDRWALLISSAFLSRWYLSPESVPSVRWSAN